MVRVCPQFHCDFSYVCPPLKAFTNAHTHTHARIHTHTIRTGLSNVLHSRSGNQILIWALGMSNNVNLLKTSPRGSIVGLGSVGNAHYSHASNHLQWVNAAVNCKTHYRTPGNGASLVQCASRFHVP